MVIIFHKNTDFTVLYCFSKHSFGEHKRFHSKHFNNLNYFD